MAPVRVGNDTSPIGNSRSRNGNGPSRIGNRKQPNPDRKSQQSDRNLPRSDRKSSKSDEKLAQAKLESGPSQIMAKVIQEIAHVKWLKSYGSCPSPKSSEIKRRPDR
eukprot:11555829-Karenia_brevis.AAC.1